MPSTLSGNTLTVATVDATDITDGTDTTSTTNIINGLVAAWVNFQGSGTVAINSDYNISSVTDQGVGQYRITFDTAMATINYCPTAWGRNTTTTQWGVDVAALSNDDLLTTHFDIFCRDDGSATRDPDPCCLAIFHAP